MYTQATNWKNSHDVCLVFSIDADLKKLRALFDACMESLSSLYAS